MLFLYNIVLLLKLQEAWRIINTNPKIYCKKRKKNCFSFSKRLQSWIPSTVPFINLAIHEGVSLSNNTLMMVPFIKLAIHEGVSLSNSTLMINSVLINFAVHEDISLSNNTLMIFIWYDLHMITLTSNGENLLVKIIFLAKKICFKIFTRLLSNELPQTSALLDNLREMSKTLEIMKN